MKLLFLGGDADGNLGDTAILAATCQSIASTLPGTSITIVSARRQAKEFAGVQHVLAPGPAGFGSLLKTARQQDLVLIGGGGLFQDDDSRAKMPYWALRLGALRLMNSNIVGHSLGAGPLQHWESQQLACLACTTMKSVSVRDEFARGWLQECTTREIEVVPDPAFMLVPQSRDIAADYVSSCGLSPDRPIIGVSLRRWFHRRGMLVPHRVRSQLGLDRDHGSTEMKRLLDLLAAELCTIARRMNAQILLMPSYRLAHEGDEQVCRALMQRLSGVENAIALLDDPTLYKAVAGRLSLMISARMHPLILAASMGVPIVGLAYNGKFEGLFENLGLPRRLLWLNDLGRATRLEGFDTLVNDALNDKTDVRHRAAMLADRTHRSTARLLETSGLAVAGAN